MKQNKAASAVAKGLAAGAVVGTAAYMMSTMPSRKNNGMNQAKRKAGKALKAVGAVIENVSYMMK